MDTTAPKPKELSEAAGISPSYASMILGGQREPPPELAALIFREFGLRLGIFVGLDDADTAAAIRIHSKNAAA